MKINKKFALQLPKHDFYSFKLCTVDKVHAVRPVDNNTDIACDLDLWAFDSEQLSYTVGHAINPSAKSEDPVPTHSWVEP